MIPDAPGCQALRIASFLFTVLPGPAHHCRLGQATARNAWPRYWWQHAVVDVQRQSSHSCGDLVFSSHTTFILSFVLCYTYYGKASGGRGALPHLTRC